MAVLQVYQADLLKQLDHGEGISLDAVQELRWDIALCLNKQTACAIGRSMAALLTIEQHLWLDLILTP